MRLLFEAADKRAFLDCNVAVPIILMLPSERTCYSILSRLEEVSSQLTSRTNRGFYKKKPGTRRPAKFKLGPPQVGAISEAQK